MKERPILFSGSMIRAILAGTKTVTRRMVNMGRGRRQAWIDHVGPGGSDTPADWGFADEHETYYVLDQSRPLPGQLLPPGDTVGTYRIPCPYGRRGDRLWVRETWVLAHPDYHTEAEGVRLGRPTKDGRWCHYRATDAVDMADGPGWRPSIFMPRWASRIALEITDVAVERLQSITEEQARAEGVSDREEYRALWDQINGAGAWNLNPWVWCVSFRRATP